MPANYLWGSSLTQSQWSICTANGPTMSFIYEGKFMDLQETVFHLIRSFHNCFLTENISVSHGKTKPKQKKPQTQTSNTKPHKNLQKTPNLFCWIAFPWIKNIFRKIEVKNLSVVSVIFLLCSAFSNFGLLKKRGRISKHQTDQNTFIHVLTERELRKHLNVRNFWNCFALHIFKFLLYHTMRALNKILLFFFILL